MAMQRRRGNGHPGVDAGVLIALGWVVFSAPVVFVLLRTASGAWPVLLGYELGCFLAMRAGGMYWGRLPRLGECVAWGGVTALVLLLAWKSLPQLQQAFAGAAPVLEKWGVRGNAGVVVLGWYVVVNPWIEEGFWRGTLLGRRCASSLGPTGSLLVAVFGFVPFHLVAIRELFGARAWWLAIPILLGSMVWSWMTRRRASVIPAVISHQVADLVIVLIALQQRSAV